jgi:hypothetical protein
MPHRHQQFQNQNNLLDAVELKASEHVFLAISMVQMIKRLFYVMVCALLAVVVEEDLDKEYRKRNLLMGHHLYYATNDNILTPRTKHGHSYLLFSAVQ